MYRQREDAVWDVDITTDGTNIDLEITGDASEDVEWIAVVLCIENNP